MDKTKSINRLFFGMTLWMIAAPYLLGRLLIHLSVTQLNVAGEFIFMFPVILYMVFNGTDVGAGSIFAASADNIYQCIFNAVRDELCK